ncbi:hypothetical protein ACS0TY_025031 [Phlomoides rotata]
MVNSNTGKKTLGRRRIEIKKIEKRSNLQVTFTKRRIGLFKKASELSLLCGAQIAILVQSPGGKIYSFGHPSVEDLINCFLTADVPPPQITDDEAVMRLAMEEWESLELHQLEEYLEALQTLADKVSEKLSG